MSPTVTPRPARAGSEPRNLESAVKRYPVQFDLCYKLVRTGQVLERGLGKTREFSQGKVRFSADRILPIGADLELSLDWPLRIHGVSSLHLIISGHVIRSSRKESTLKITRYEFRTRGAQPIASTESVRTSGFQVHVGTRAMHARRG